MRARFGGPTLRDLTVRLGDGRCAARGGKAGTIGSHTPKPVRPRMKGMEQKKNDKKKPLKTPKEKKAEKAAKKAGKH